jgi:arylsulfatase A-like enzyme
VDFPASFAALTGQSLAGGDAPDSMNVLAALLGESPSGRESLVEQAGVLALRRGPWKYIEPGRGAKRTAQTNTETGQDPAGQLFHLADDPGETRSLLAVQADQAAAMKAELERIRSGRAGLPPGGGK